MEQRRSSRSDEWYHATRLFFRLRARGLRQPRGRRLDGQLEDGLLGGGGLVFCRWSSPLLLPRIEAVPGSEEVRTQDQRLRLLGRDQVYAGQGVAHVRLLRYPHDLVQLLLAYEPGQLYHLHD